MSDQAENVKVIVFETFVGYPLIMLYEWFPPFKRFLERRHQHILDLLDRLYPE